jgi:hypothetical protein
VKLKPIEKQTLALERPPRPVKATSEVPAVSKPVDVKAETALLASVLRFLSGNYPASSRRQNGEGGLQCAVGVKNE